jgi:Raf kinase inhibitor-like YbhB/YbcL family protein
MNLKRLEDCDVEKLKIKSKAFDEGGWIPLKYTARGTDISPDLEITGISSDARSIAITMDDASHPVFPNYNHWVIWNIVIQSVIPEGIAHGKYVDSLGAVQGVAYGRNKYKGPKPPFRATHTYVFTVYILDCTIDLEACSRKKDFMDKANGHIIQQAALSGKFQSRRQ